MKKTVHKANTRGFANHGWLKSHHTFSFSSYQNPERMNFGMLRVLNDDVVQPGQGYYLLVDNFSNNATGFTLTWTGSAANNLECAAQPPCGLIAEAGDPVTECEGGVPFILNVCSLYVCLFVIFVCQTLVVVFRAFSSCIKFLVEARRNSSFFRVVKCTSCWFKLDFLWCSFANDKCF